MRSQTTTQVQILIYMEQQVDFVFGLKARAARVETATAERLVRRMLASYGTDELYEWYHDHTIGKLVFDIDGKPAAIDAPTLLADSLRAVHTFLGHEPACVRIAASHGPNKLSFRIFVPGYRMALADVKKRIVRLKLDKDRPFDSAIYGSNQKLRMVGSIKTKEDRRPLKLIDATGAPVAPTPDLLLDTLVQVVDPDWPLLEESEAGFVIQQPEGPEATALTVAANPTVPPPRKRGRPSQVDTLPPDVRALLEGVGFREPRSLKVRDGGYDFTAANRSTENPCPCCPHVHESNNFYVLVQDRELKARNYSERCAFRRIPRTVEEIAPLDEAGFQTSLDMLALSNTGGLGDEDSRLHYHTYRVACTRSECYACERRHATNQVVLKQVFPRVAWTVQSISPECEPRFFYHTQELYHFISTALTSPSHQTIANLFLLGHREILWADSPNNVKLWSCAPDDPLRIFRWKSLDSHLFTTMLSSWLTDLVISLRHLPQLRDAGKQLNALWALVKTHSNIKGIRDLLVGSIKATNTVKAFDTDPYLLGCDNGVVDLKAGAFRPARREDFVTKSVGYSYPVEGVSAEDTARLQEYMEAIYPIEEERRFVQRYLGYCLLGKHHEPILLCLTDTRDGGNGKSTVIKFTWEAVGDYFLEGPKGFLYKQNRPEDPNSHDAGLIKFEGKRVSAFEEPSTGTKLDTDALKRLNGGRSTPLVRPPHATESRPMEFITKMILAFNKGGFPNIPVDQESTNAFLKRVVVINHRALFCKRQDEWDTHKNEPYTYRADAHRLDTDTKRLRPAMLDWMLEGYADYDNLGFHQLPEACTAWKQRIVDENDQLAQWIETEDPIIPDTESYFTTKAAHAAFSAAGFKMGKIKFNNLLKTRFATQWQDRSPDGKERNTFWGVRLK